MIDLLIPWLLASVSVANALAGPVKDCPSPQVMEASGKRAKLCYSSRWRGWISESCLASPSCGAVELSKSRLSFKSKPEPGYGDGGRSPGSWYCGKLGGKVVIANDDSGPRASQAAFCEAKDGTWLDLTALQ